jgi:glycosyltransferase involved in cell wall biosynthesis
VYSGSLGGRYRLCDLAAFVAAAASEAPGTTLTILSWAPAAEVQNAMRRAGVADSVWTLRSVDHAHMPHELATHDAGLHFTAAEAGGAGGSPTKIGEYWACGLPVVATTGIGDLDEIIRAEHVGALVHGQSARAFHNAASALRDLLRDRMLPLRCRHTAEKYYSLERGCAAQLTLYGLARARL